MGILTTQNITPAGVGPSFAAATVTGDKAPASSNERDIIHVKNGGGASITVTIPAQTGQVTQEGVGNLTVPDIVVSVPASGEREIGPIAQAYVGADGNINVNYSAVTTVTVAAKRLPPVSRSFI